MIRLLVLLILLSTPLPACAAFDHSHKLLSAELNKYVDDSLVHYRKWKDHPEGLNKYIDLLAAIDPEEYTKFSENEKKALWINAYNALIIKIVVDHYPVHGSKPYYPPNSARQIPDLWEAYQFKVAGKEVNLYGIEHRIIRKEFKDPRMHFAVVCASKGCPILRKSAYRAETLDNDLDVATRTFITDPKHVQFDPEQKLVRVSLIFHWFPLDFVQATGFKKVKWLPPSEDEIVLSYVLSFASPEVRQKFADLKGVHVVYMPYDWSLNDADSQNVQGRGSHLRLGPIACGCLSL